MPKAMDSEKFIYRAVSREPEILKQANALHQTLVNLRYEGKAAQGKNMKALQKVIEYFEQDASQFMYCEEHVIFPYLEIHVPKLIPILEIFRIEHENLRRSVHSLSFAVWVFAAKTTEGQIARLIEEIWDTGHYLEHLLKERIVIKQRMLDRMIQEQLREDERNDLFRKIHAAPRAAVRR